MAPATMMVSAARHADTVVDHQGEPEVERDKTGELGGHREAVPRHTDMWVVPEDLSRYGEVERAGKLPDEGYDAVTTATVRVLILTERPSGHLCDGWSRRTIDWRKRADVTPGVQETRRSNRPGRAPHRLGTTTKRQDKNHANHHHTDAVQIGKR